MLAAVIQLCSTPNRKENLATTAHWMMAAVQRGAGLLVLPENFSFMGHIDHTADSAAQQRQTYRENPANSPSLQFVQNFAQKHQVWVVAGSIPLAVADSTKMTNTCFVVDHTGQVRGRYDKIHLFDANLGGNNTPYRESNLVQAGHTAVLVDTPFGKIGLSVCYDLRFPELFRTLTAHGATILTVPAAFTATTGQAHWEVLLRARAIENFAYVLAAGQEGRHANGRHTFGHSMVIDPWGHVIALCPEGPGFALAELQPSRVEQCRHRIPCLKHQVVFSPPPE